MDKLRRDVHTAFARHQGGLGSTTGASERLLRKALAAAATDPIPDLRGSAAYKRAMAEVWTARALREVA